MIPQAVAFVIAIGILAASGGARTQDSPLKTNVAAASVEVDVRDAKGNSVAGLTAADFVVTENRQRRPVISVDYLAPRTTPRPTAVAEAAPDVVTNRESDTAGAVLFVLDDSTPMLAGDGLRVVPLVSDAIRRAPTGDRIGLFFAAARKFNVPFSQDRARLLAAARKFTAKADLGSIVINFDPVTVANPGFGTLDDAAETLYHATIRAIRGGVETLAMQPYRRKALILFSAGLPLTPGDEPRGSSLARELRAEYNAVVAEARQAGISVNVVEPGGLRADFGSLRSSTFDAPAGGTGRLNREFLTALARETGGLAGVGTNEPASVIDRMLNDAASFYLVRFGTDLTASTAVPSTIAVTTTRGAATVRPRRDAVGAAPAKAPALGDALLRTTPGVPLDLAMIPVPVGPGRPAALIAVVQVRRSTGGTTVPRQHRFTLVVSAYAADGHPAASRKTRVNTVLPAGQEDITFEIVTRLDVPPGWYSVRAAIEADEDPKLGSVLGDVEVPRFGDAPMTMSGLAIAVSPPLMSQPKAALDGLRLTMPTALRIFRATERISATALIAIDGRTALGPVDAEFQILTDTGRTVLKESRRLAAADFTAGIAEITFPVVLTNFEQGEYWISLRAIAADGKTLSRSSRFEIR